MRVISSTGENLGVLTKSEALRKAEEDGLDLVIIAETAVPPVAKILDFKKYLYEENKKRSAAKAKSKKSELKELKIGATTSQGDINQRISRAIEFLKDGNKVKFSVTMSGRQNLFPEEAKKKLQIVIDALKDIAKMEDEPKRIGSTFWTVFVSK